MSDSILLSMLACIYTLNVADYYLTLSAVSKGATEANPIMATILHTPMFPVVKLFCIPAILCMIWVARANVRPAIVRAVWVPMVAYVLLGLWHLYVAMLFWGTSTTLPPCDTRDRFQAGQVFTGLYFADTRPSKTCPSG